MMGGASAGLVNGQCVSSILRFVEGTSSTEMLKQGGDNWMCRVGPIIALLWHFVLSKCRMDKLCILAGARLLYRYILCSSCSV